MKYATSNFVAIVIIGSAAIIHFILHMMVALYVDKRKDRHFVKEYNRIYKAHHETDNAETFLNELSNMEHSPKTKESANAFYLSMSTAMYKNNRQEEALSYLDKLDTSNTDLQSVIKEQRKMIADGENRNI